MSLDVERPKTKSLSEVYQHKDIKFSFANRLGKDKVRQIHTYAKCRDFLGDAIYAEESGKPVSIYSFTFDPKVDKIDRDKTRILVKFPNTTDMGWFSKQMSLLHQIEKNNNLSFTEPFDATKEEIMVEADMLWQASTPLLSLYTFLLKGIAYDLKGDYGKWMDTLSQQSSNEGQYINLSKTSLGSFMDRLGKFIPKNGKTTTGWPHDQAMSIIHHASGFVSIFSGVCVEGGYNLDQNEYRKMVLKG